MYKRQLLRSTLYNSLAKDTPKIFFAGNSISPTYLNEVIEPVSYTHLHTCGYAGTGDYGGADYKVINLIAEWIV